jgi:Flp pilus assembly protein TadG
MTRRILARLAGNRSGGAAAELALLLPVLVTMLFGSIDVANGFAMKLALEQAAGTAAELATAPGTVATSYAFLAEEAAAAYGKPYRTAVADAWLECGGARQGAFDVVCGPGLQTARYISIRIDAEYVPQFRFGGLITGEGPNGGFITQGDAVVRIQ